MIPLADRTRRRIITAALGLVVALAVAVPLARAQDFPLSLENRKSGISLLLSGANGTDWAVERFYGDPSIAIQVVYLKSDVEMSLAHNENNTVTNIYYSQHVIGADGADGSPDSGDEGVIYWKMDLDLKAHNYTAGSDSLPDYCRVYSGPFTFDGMTYDGTDDTLAVLGTTGDNGGEWGSLPRSTSQRWAYGQQDAFGNEWHTLTYWDDDYQLLTASGTNVHRQACSDGHCVFICVNPQTPVLQLHAPDGEQFYTTPAKTYFIPKIWDQTSYVTDGVLLSFVNLTNGEAVQYRVDGGAWQTFSAGSPPAASAVIPVEQTPVTLEYRCGPDGVVASRTVVRNPVYPGQSEEHGFMLWADEAGRLAVRDRLKNVQPWKKSYADQLSGRDTPATFQDRRGQWRAVPNSCGSIQADGICVALEGADAVPHIADNGRQRLLRLGRLQPIGTEINVNSSTPAKDYMNELGQTMQGFGDAAMGYDLLVAHFRGDQVTGGITPIEELLMRDNLAKVARCMLQMRANWSAHPGGGDTHWSHGYDLAVQQIAMAMPTYKTPFGGASGADMTTVNDLADALGEYWNPYPYQGATWFEVTTDPEVDTPGHPGVRYPMRVEFLMTDDGWWTGPNDFVGDGSRYFTGPNGRRLVDINYGGMANAECRVELVEMHGYESPFVERLYLVDHIRRLKGLRPVPLCAENYIRRRLMMGGYVGLSWDSDTKTYTARDPSVASALRAFNHTNNYAGHPTPRQAAGQFISDLNLYYGYAALPGFPSELSDERRSYMNDSGRKVFFDLLNLILCEHPDEVPAPQPEPNRTPIIKPLSKHVVHPGETIKKEIIAVDPNDNPLTITVTGMPDGATFDPAERLILWVPEADDEGVWIAQVTASDGTASVTRPFAMICKADAPSGPIPGAPGSLTAAYVQDDSAVELNWTAPAGVDVAAYIIWREGGMIATTPPGVTTYTDSEMISPGQHTRYYVSCLSTIGAESSVRGASPSPVHLEGPTLGLGPMISEWALLSDHGPAGEIATPVVGVAGEPRDGGLQAMRITFNRPLDPATVSPAAISVVGQNSGDVSGLVSAATLVDGGYAIHAGFSSSPPDGDSYTVAIAPSVAGLDGQAVEGDLDLVVTVCRGDVDGSGQTTAADTVALRAKVGQSLGPASAAYDVNRSGGITGDDVQAIEKWRNGG